MMVIYDTPHGGDEAMSMYVHVGSFLSPTLPILCYPSPFSPSSPSLLPSPLVYRALAIVQLSVYTVLQPCIYIHMLRYIYIHFLPDSSHSLSDLHIHYIYMCFAPLMVAFQIGRAHV